jgi:hypothetical protein
MFVKSRLEFDEVGFVLGYLVVNSRCEIAYGSLP